MESGTRNASLLCSTLRHGGCAVEADQTNFALGKDSFAAFQYGKKDAEDKFSIKGQTSVKLGAEYKVCAATTMKAGRRTHRAASDDGSVRPV